MSFVHFLGEVMAGQFCFEINRPLSQENQNYWQESPEGAHIQLITKIVYSTALWQCCYDFHHFKRSFGERYQIM